jgi:hypothetical protein
MNGVPKHIWKPITTITRDDFERTVKNFAVFKLLGVSNLDTEEDADAESL